MKNKVKSIAAITACVGLCAAVLASQPKSIDTPTASAASNVDAQIAANAPAPERVLLSADGTQFETALSQTSCPSAASMQEEGGSHHSNKRTNVRAGNIVHKVEPKQRRPVPHRCLPRKCLLGRIPLRRRRQSHRQEHHHPHRLRSGYRLD